MKVSKQFRNLCWSPLDRNNGSMFVCCPQFYYLALKKLFYDDNHYTHQNCSTVSILQTWKTFYNKQNLKRYFLWPRGELQSLKLPYAYALMKNKDINKSRPIVSYASHPLQKMLNYTGRSVMFLLLNNSDLKHFTLPRTQDFIKSYMENVKDKISKLSNYFRCLTM